VSIFRAYEADSLGVSIAGTSATPAMYFAPSSTADANLCKIKVAVEGASSPAPPSNGSVLFVLAKVTGTVGGGASVTPQPTGQSTLAATTVVKSGSTALTGLTQGVTLWTGVIPFTAGASWSDDFENTGFELSLAASGLYAVYFTAASGAGSGCNARVIAWLAE
jgi:hypothetical protein